MRKDTLDFIKEKVKRYSKLLNLDLQGWKITVECDCIEAIRDDLMTMTIDYNSNTKVSILNVTSEATLQQFKSIEEVVIHELLHLKFWYVDIEKEDALKSVLLENTINELALILSGEHR